MHTRAVGTVRVAENPVVLAVGAVAKTLVDAALAVVFDQLCKSLGRLPCLTAVFAHHEGTRGAVAGNRAGVHEQRVAVHFDDLRLTRVLGGSRAELPRFTMIIRKKAVGAVDAALGVIGGNQDAVGPCASAA